MSNVANTEDVRISDNQGKVGANNAIDVKGGLGKNTELSNTTGITVIGKNTDTARIGADNSYDLKDGSRIGNTAGVTVGNNSGAIGAGNRVNIS
uniref:Uncharacterized protein n=1 Tax=Dicentrarchus labrax TaxID=13489 RepID=A0A8P4KC12_DICLA